MSPSRTRRSRPRLNLQLLEVRLAPATDTWINAAGGAWATGANWSLNNPPQPGDDAVINGLNGGATVTLASGGTTTIHGLELDSGNALILQSGNLTVASSGAISGTLTIKQGNTLTVPAGATLNVNNGAILVAPETGNGAFGISVGGTMNVTGATFSHTGSWNSSSLQVSAGGHLTATGSTFDWSLLSLANNTVLNSGDISSNTFNQTIAIPAADAALLSDNRSFQDVVLQPGTLSSGQTVSLAPLGTVESTTQRYVFNAATGNLAVPAGATLNVSSGAVLVASETSGTIFGLSVAGTLNIQSATFSSSGGWGSSTIQVSAGGHLTATGSTFGWSGLSWANGSVLGTGDVTGNTFNQTITIPAADAVLLANNLSFENIDLQPGSVSSGQTVTLPLLGTSNTANQRYVFTASTGLFNVQAGGILNVTNFAVLFAAETSGTTFGISVTGTMNIAGATFSSSGGWGSSAIQVNSAGHLTATGSTFAWSRLSLANGSHLNSGDVTGNSFNQTITVPAIDVPLLANNAIFHDVNLQPGSLTGGQTLTLPLLGTVSTGSQRYVFTAATGSYAVQAGATLNIGTGAVVVATETSGTMFGLSIDGTLNIQSATFSTSGGWGSSALQVNSGGHLTATDSTFAWSRLSLANGTVLTAGDIVGNTFNQTITIPLADAPLLVNNASFKDIAFQPGSLTSGQAVTLVPIGTVSTGSQRYVFTAATGSYAVPAGAILNIEGGSVVVAAETSGATFGLSIAGTLNIQSATFSSSGGWGSSAVQVNAGGHLTAISSSFAWSNVNLNSGSTDAIQFSSFANKFTINSGATINVSLNDFGAIGANGVVAAGTSTATIDLRNNYWGTTDATAIAGKIHDHVDDVNLPTVLFDPWLTSPDSSFFDPAGLPIATAGAGYDQTITAASGTGPTSNFSVSSGALPGGLTLTTDGELSGTPTAAGTFTFIISADDNSPTSGPFTANQLYWLFVNAPTITVSPTTLPDTPTGAFYNQSLGASGGTAPYGPFTVTGGALPSGLTLATDGTLSGTPTADGVFNFVVTVQDSTTGPSAPYNGSRVFTIVVDDTPPTPGTVNDGPGVDVDSQVSATTIAANWSGFSDLDSGIAGYRWAIGTTPGGTDVRPFTLVGNVPGASATGLTLVDGNTYFVSVKAVDNAGNESPVAMSDGVTVDSTPPIAGVVNDGPGTDVDFQPSRTTIAANWTGFADVVSGIASYQWAIGTTPGGTNVQPFTNVGTSTSALNSGLTLAEDSTYYVSVKATDGVGNVSAVATSDGVRVVPTAPIILNFTDDTGVLGDGITSDTTPTLTGTAEALSTIRVYDGPTLLGQTTADTGGAWQYTTPALADGTHSIAATASDPGGNTSDLSTPLVLTTDTTAPAVAINQAPAQMDPTNAPPVVFAVHFNEPVTGFTVGDVNLSASTVGGTLSAAVSGSGANYIVTVTGMTGTGTVVASIPAGAVIDAAGNASTASTSTDNGVTFDNDAPTVTINQAAGQADPTDVAPVVFAVHFSESVTGFTAADVDLSASSVAGTLVAAVSGSGADYVVSITGMFGAGTVVASIPNGAAADAAGNPSGASTSTDNLVFFNHVGQFRFGAPLYNTDENGGSVLVTVSRVNGGDGPATVAYATSNGSATAGDYGAVSGTLTWIDGNTLDQTITIPILPDSLSEGKETFGLALSAPSANATLGSPAATKVTINKSGGLTFTPSSKNSQFTVTDALGNQETVRMGGGVGSLTYYLTNGQFPISEIDLNGTDPAKSTVSIAVKRPKGATSDGLVGIGEIDGTGLKSLSLGKNYLDGSVGDGINLSGFLGLLTVGDIRNGADIVVAGAPPKAGQTVRITAGVIEDGTDLTVTGAPLGSLTAVRIGVGSITAPSVGLITVKGRAKTKTTPALPGDLLSNLTVLGTGVTKGPALKSLHVAGAVSGVAITVGGAAGTVGDVGSVSVGSFVDSTLLAGYTGTFAGSEPFSLTATVGSFVVRPPTKVAPNNTFARSYVIASNFNTVSLGAIDLDDGGTKFGFVYHTLLKSLKVKSPAPGFTFDPKDPSTQDFHLSNFEVKKV
jgi:Bacterial Ig-like domain/Calx-beta domain